jgi:hypothetical protein
VQGLPKVKPLKVIIHKLFWADVPKLILALGEKATCR